MLQDQVKASPTGSARVTRAGTRGVFPPPTGRWLYTLLLAALASLSAPAQAWWGDGHRILTEAAVESLPDQMPGFFSAGLDMIAHCVYDADLAKSRNVPHLRDAEGPEHYLDLELLEGEELPDTRHAFLDLCARLQVSPSKVGLAPYATIEWMERLAVAFAEHRKWPDNPHIRSKCLVYAGHLAHYAQDLCQPLHVTIHFDGMVGADGSSPHSGIHEKVDALVERLELTPHDLSAGLEVSSYSDPMREIRHILLRSHSLVPTVYSLENDLSQGQSPALEEFARERAQAAVAVTACLYMTAWETSAQVQMPGWLKR